MIDLVRRIARKLDAFFGFTRDDDFEILDALDFDPEDEQ